MTASLWGTVTQVSPLQVTYVGETVPVDVSRSAVAKPILGAACVIYANNADRWLVAQRGTPASVAAISESTIEAADFVTSGFSTTGFTSQDVQLQGYAELLATIINDLTARCEALDSKVNELRSALILAGIVSP